MIVLKTAAEIARMRAAGRVVAAVLDALSDAAQPGVLLSELDQQAADIIAGHGGASSFKGYQPESAPYPFPGVTCLSVNDELVHGIPGPRRLKRGDLLKIDVGVCLNGYHADAARPVVVGGAAANPRAARLAEVTERCFWAALEQMRAGRRFGDVGAAIQSTAEASGFAVVREFTSHGVGRTLHEGFSMLNYGEPGIGMLLRPGLTMALEPMLTEGDWRTRLKRDGWTVLTKDGKLAAQFEHSVAVTDGAPEILTVAS